MSNPIDITKAWINQVVVGCNFCPFAQREVERDSIRYTVIEDSQMEAALEAMLIECHRLDQDPEIETTLLIFPDAFTEFNKFLELLDYANELLIDQGYEGVYQLASFHPDYEFADSEQDDAANFTNRSPYPMLHLLREESIERVLAKYPHPEEIPVRNVEKARTLGFTFFRNFLSATESRVVFKIKAMIVC